MATDEHQARIEKALAELMEALTPRIEAAAPVGRPGGWPEEYRYRDGGSDYSFYHLRDPRFALRIVIENPSRFGVEDSQALSSAARRIVQALQQRGALDSVPGVVASVLIAAIGDLYAALGLTDAAERYSHLAQGATPTLEVDEGATGEPLIVTRWKGKLLDLSRKNPLLAISNRGVPVLVEESTLPDIEDVVADGVPIVIRGSEDLDELDLPSWARHATDLDSSTVLSLLSDEGIVFARDETRALTRELPGLRRRAQVAREESGASPLYLTLGGLQIMDEIAPLFLLPVTLEGSRRGPWSVQLEPQASLRFNECLVEWLRRTADFEPEVLRNPPTDHSGIDMARVFAELREAMAARRLPFEVVVDSRLALLEFSTLEMWRDLSDHWGELADNSVISHLLADREAPYVDDVPEPLLTDADESALTLPLPADGSQMKAVKWAGAGRSFVLQGPPGTGKSQTITNIIADAVANGRRVLFVAEKEAAVDVVARRLSAVGLAERCLDLRSKEQTTRGVRTHLTKALHRASGSSGALEALRARHRDLVDILADHPRSVRSEDTPPAVDANLRRRQVSAYRTASRDLRHALRDVGTEASGAARPHEWRAEDDLSALRRELRIARVEGIRELVAEHTDAILSLTRACS